MKALLALVKALYGGMLRLYPRPFRAEFGPEMQAVFSRRADAAAAAGWLSLCTAVLLEMKDYPGSVLGEYLRAGRFKMTHDPLEGNVEKPASIWALLAVAVFFIFPGTLGYLRLPWPQTGANSLVSILMVLLVLVILLGPLAVGIKAGLPRWSLVILGAVLGVLGVYGVLSLLGIIIGPAVVLFKGWITGDSEALTPRLIAEWINHGLFWFAIAIAILGFLVGLNSSDRSQKVLRRIRADWTNLSFLFYGSVLITFYIDFDEYQGEGLYVLGCLVALAAGAWAYLRIAHSGRRVLALIGGLTVCMAIMGVGKYFLVPLQDWPIWMETHPPESERWFESLRTISSWFWAAVGVGLPGLLQEGMKKRRLAAGA